MSKWVSVWGNAISIAERKVENYTKDVTLRYLISCPFGGSKIRLHFSNFCGLESITLSKVTLANSTTDREIDLNSLRRVTFFGNECVTIKKGEEIFSDEIHFNALHGQKVAVSIYLKDFTQMRSAVTVKGELSKGFFSLGDMTSSSELPLYTTRTLNVFYFLDGLDLLAANDNCHAVICYGDSITAQDWVDALALKFMANPENTTAIVRKAASGTRILREYSCITYESYGLCGKNRFEREISSVSGATSIIIQQGINDIIHPVGVEVNPFRPMSDLPALQELQEGMRYYLDIAKKHNLKIYLGTLLPIYGWRTYAPFREELKNEFNNWLRSLEYEGIDFDEVLRSIQNKFAFREEYDSGDHLHPSLEGYKKMADLAFERLTKK